MQQPFSKVGVDLSQITGAVRELVTLVITRTHWLLEKSRLYYEAMLLSAWLLTNLGGVPIH